MKRPMILMAVTGLLFMLAGGILTAAAQWVTRDERWPMRGPWLWAVYKELPQFYRELNGIDFGHA